MSLSLATLAARLAVGLAALVLTSDDPRWRLRESASAWLAHLQAQRESRLAARLEQSRLHSEFASFAAGLCLPEQGARLRSLAAVTTRLGSDILRRRELPLRSWDTWTRELADGTFLQHWKVVEREQVLRPEAAFRGQYVWQDKEVDLVFAFTAGADGRFEVVPRWTEERRTVDRLPPQLSRILDLLSPDARLLASSGLEATR
jgi:hypothetical protein